MSARVAGRGGNGKDALVRRIGAHQSGLPGEAGNGSRNVANNRLLNFAGNSPYDSTGLKRPPDDNRSLRSAT
jgi:hypothetical protein